MSAQSEYHRYLPPRARVYMCVCVCCMSAQSEYHRCLRVCACVCACTCLCVLCCVCVCIWVYAYYMSAQSEYHRCLPPHHGRFCVSVRAFARACVYMRTMSICLSVYLARWRARRRGIASKCVRLVDEVRAGLVDEVRAGLVDEVRADLVDARVKVRAGLVDEVRTLRRRAGSAKP